MKVGITTDLRFSMFSAGHANACLSIAKIFQATNSEIMLIHKQEGRDWWDDVEEMKTDAPKRVFLGDLLKSGDKLDLLIEVTFTLSPSDRAAISKKSVWYNRKPSLFYDIESTVYGNKPEPRNLEGVSSIWLANIFTNEEDVDYLQTLYPKIPVSKVPWIWTPDIVEAYRSKTKSPVWPQAYDILDKASPWNIHVTETNTSTCSSCTIPMTAMRQLLLHGSDKYPISRITIHNMDVLKSVRFFNENILKHTSVPDISYNLIGRQRVIDWVHDPHSIVLSHSRFIPIKMANLEAAWVGIPIIHNSEIMRSLGCGLENTFYPNNSITGAVDAIQRLLATPGSIGYSTKLDTLSELRNKIIEKFYPLAKIQAWGEAITKVMNMASPTPLPVPVASPLTAVPAPANSSEITVLFTDMWDQFNPSYNMFTLALENGLKSKKVKVAGYSKDTIGTQTPDIVIFGPFGEDWKALPPTWPKVHFTGENTEPIKDPSVKLNIGYKLPEISDDSYLRMPLWMFEIDWFGADHVKLRNPLPLPIDTCTKVNPGDYSKRSKFCAFIVTNPRCHARNNAFKTLNTYKPVDSAGRLYNNVGDVIFAGLGGGGGEIKKHTFLKDYRFCIAYENEAVSGYTTEKILHAKAAGCVPIYWGDSKVGRDFNQKGFINANNCKSEADLIELVDAVESDPVKWQELASVPALSTYSRDLVRRTFSEMVRRILLNAGKETLAGDLPSFLGAKTTAEAEALRLERNESMTPSVTSSVTWSVTTSMTTSITSSITISNEKPLCVTGATQRFWPFLIMWLNSMKSMNMPTRVYVGADVTDSSISLTKEKFKDTEFIRFPTETPKSFPGFWEPQHFAWKLWIFHVISEDLTLKGRTIYYTDSGSITVRWPKEWIKSCQESGLAFLNDSTQINRQWCNESFCQILNVTENEKAAQQIWAGGCSFVAGHPLSKKVFNQAYEMAQNPKIIVGEKWSGTGPDGKPFGHRHDQSILSIIGLRENVPTFPLEKVYGQESARTTFHNGQCIYVHRGQYKSHNTFLNLTGIDDAFIINLERRADRKESFLKEHTYMKGKVRCLPAYDGRKLELTPSLTRLFKTNDFFWKKSVMGCALSHFKLWNLLINEPPEMQNYLIMEDDARLAPGWQTAWETAYKSLPEEWDCVYLGGVLPPNRDTFSSTLKRVGPGLARVAPNQIFGQKRPTTYFHFCAYAYVLSKRGAEKILKSIIENDGYWTSADHMICNRVDKMNIFVLDPMVAGASQDDDPVYKTAQFNNFSRIDTFDSDLWNNDDRFSPEEVKENLLKNLPLSITAPIIELDKALHEKADVKPQVKPQVKADEVSTTTTTVVVPAKKGVRFLSLDVCKVTTSSLYESKWLEDILQREFIVEQVAQDANLDDCEHIVLLVIKHAWSEQLAWMSSIRKTGRTFKIIHLSDEFASDPIDFYSWPEITGVLRFYPRPDLIQDPKVIVVPLGYHRQFRGNRDVPHLSTPELPFRENMWSFAGTNWKNRANEMMVLQSIEPHYVRWFDNWKDPKQLKDEEYICLMLNSKFIACPKGQNIETYRFYEALDCGCIPLFLESPELEPWLRLFNNELPFLKIQSWGHATGLLQHFQQNPEQMEGYRRNILTGWAKFKIGLKDRVRQWLAV